MKLLALGIQNLELKLKKYENMSHVKVKMSKTPSYFERYCSTHSDQAPAISGLEFLSCTLPRFCCRDFDLGHMTLKLNRDLDILKMYLLTENELARSRYSKYIAC